MNYRDLNALFDSLDRKASHTELRPTQIEALNALTAQRDQRDHILKLSTGAGKTSVALLYLKSHMEEKNLPGVYLCPTIQLCQQVVEESTRLGIDAKHLAAGQMSLPVDAVRGKQILVCTYDKLFNAKSIFARPENKTNFAAIVLDDVHAGYQKVRESFTIKVKSGELYQKITKVVSGAFTKYKNGTYQDIVEGRENFVTLEVPYWSWRSIHSQISALIVNSEEDFGLVWPLIRDSFKFCRCVFGNSSVEISPSVLPISTIPAFSEASKRLFMSATLADDSQLVRDLGCDLNAALKPILLPSDRGVGERMVLAPSLINESLNRQWVINW